MSKLDRACAAAFDAYHEILRPVSSHTPTWDKDSTELDQLQWRAAIDAAFKIFNEKETHAQADD